MQKTLPSDYSSFLDRKSQFGDFSGFVLKHGWGDGTETESLIFDKSPEPVTESE
jgi:hypothetical protein